MFAFAVKCLLGRNEAGPNFVLPFSFGWLWGVGSGVKHSSSTHSDVAQQLPVAELKPYSPAWGSALAEGCRYLGELCRIVGDGEELIQGCWGMAGQAEAFSIAHFSSPLSCTSTPPQQ